MNDDCLNREVFEAERRRIDDRIDTILGRINDKLDAHMARIDARFARMEGEIKAMKSDINHIAGNVIWTVSIISVIFGVISAVIQVWH